MDVSQYLDIFIDETKEHLQNLNTHILELEQDGENMDTINEIFRAAHSLKGMAGTMGYKRMQTLTHDMENVFSEVRNGNIKVDSDMIDLLFKCLDALEEYLTTIQETADEGTNDNEPLVKGLNDILNAKKGEEPKEEKKTKKFEKKSKKEEKESAKEDSAKAKWRDIKIDDSVKTVITEGAKNNIKAYGITVYIQEACLLKAARAFLVFKALEELGEVVVSVPSAQDIEDESFGFDFSVIFMSDKPLDQIISAIKYVSEIEDAVGGEVDLNGEEEEKAEETVNEGVPAVAEEKPAVNSAPTQAPAKTNSSSNAPDKKSGKPVVNRTVRVDIEKLDSLMNLVSELIISKNSLVSVAGSVVGSSNLAFNEQIEYLESVTTNLHESVMKVRMVPIENTVNKFPRMIRDLSKKLNKKMELYMTGEDTELDRTVVDEIGDPLMHLLRN